MTQQAYDDIANAIAEIPIGANGESLARAAQEIAAVLKRENPKFNDQKFIERACSLA